MLAKLKQRTDSPWLTCAITLASYFIFLLFQLIRSQGDPSAFIIAGDVFIDPSQAPASLLIRQGKSGYDGQFYYRLALDPFNTQPVDYGIHFDLPAYRQQRVKPNGCHGY